MKLRSKAGLLAGVAAGVCAGVLAWAAGPASAAVGGSDVGFPGSSLVIQASGPFAQGKYFHVLVTGFNFEPDSATSDEIPFDMEIYLLAAKVGTCPMVPEGMNALVKKYPQDTEILFGGQPVPEASSGGPGLYGGFTIPIFTATAGNSFSGPLYICGYSVYGGDEDAAWYSFGPVTIKPATGGSSGSGSIGGAGGAGAGGAGPPSAGTKPKPQALASPRVTRAGKQLVCSRGRWSGAPTEYSYKWVVTRVRGTAGLGRRLAVTRGMRGREAECSVTATNERGSVTATSRPFKIP